MAALPTPRFDEFYRYEPLTELLFAFAEARPNLVSVRSIGKSFEGRDIWVLVLTNTATGADVDKPAFWLDGNIHAAELTASTTCLYYLNHLVTGYGVNPEVTQLLDTRAVYMVPRLNPDGAELALADRPRHIRSSTRPYPFDEAPVDGLSAEDVDGDGRILTMRIRDPHGGYKKHAEEPRLMVAREPGEFGGEYYRLIPEGFIKNHDGLTVTVNKDREGLDLNRNFPSEWRQEYKQVGAGPYPTSEPEVRAMVDFIIAHPNIGAAISYHTHSGVILRPMGGCSDEDMIPEDLWSYKRFSALGEKLSGYPAISIWHDFKYHPKEIITGTQDWVYEQLGALFWVVELWSPNKEAGIEGYKWIDWYREHPVEDDLKLLKWSDEQCGGQAHVDWREFHHPQLGDVEIGGWDKMNFWRNPPPALREREAARFPAWMDQIALSLPKLEILRTEVRALGPDTWRIRLAVANSGYLPAYVTKRALERKVVRGVMFEIHLPVNQPEVSLVSGKERMEGPQLEGHAPKSSQQAFLPSREVTADRAVGEWVVRAPQGTRLALTACADRAGTVRTEVVLD
ncbi:M14 family zinc carboxypeptidase [Paucibacter sp. KCTC 42545]|uniref:M14 family zinc carboxypeptidase n=1 Tax=Paucibacter sp. KCTC 42545 TaxID=1768242 RepID=UPI000733A5C3|nr:M14 family zinc carboxypeptidase [Paucibacter sp. KCTC 42545]ALT78632.1 carboxypeptidase [Paucibacter sp. KCTC 42545]